MDHLQTTSNASLTVAELATFLGISSWRATIDLSAHSCFVELRRFANGAVGERLIECDHARLLPKKQKVTVMLGRQRAAISFSQGGSALQPFEEAEPECDLQWPISLPETIGLGDYVLLVQAPRYFDGYTIEDMPAFAKGFLLRIRSA